MSNALMWSIFANLVLRIWWILTMDMPSRARGGSAATLVQERRHIGPAHR